MSVINFFGDFVVHDAYGLHLDGSLKQLVESSDFNVVNFEAPVIKSHFKKINKSGPNIHQCDKSPEWLETNSFNVVSLANNHALDYGIEGLEYTKSLFLDSKIMGVGFWDEAYKIQILETKEKYRVGILALTHKEFGTLSDSWNKNLQEGCAWLLHPSVKTILLNARKQVDVLVVYAHAGVEYMDYPLPEYRDLYRSFIDIGVDAVIASHTHVPQGYEMYKEKIICYSLGNFCFQKEGKLRKYWNNSLCCTLECLEGKLLFKVTPLIYTSCDNKITVDRSNSFLIHLEELNHNLNDSKVYMSIIENSVLSLASQYYGHLSHSGFLNISSIKSFVKGLADVLKSKPLFNKVHLLNTIQCETHRWTLTRAIRKINRIDF